MRKELFLFVEEKQPKEKNFGIDQCLSGLGHTVVKLPTYMFDLNVMELAWTKVQNYVRNANTEGNLSFERL
jgi:hypothetical protein